MRTRKGDGLVSANSERGSELRCQGVTPAPRRPKRCSRCQRDAGGRQAPGRAMANGDLEQSLGTEPTPNVRGEAGPTVLRLAREAHHVPPAPRGQGAMPLGLASTEGLGLGWRAPTLLYIGARLSSAERP